MYFKFAIRKIKANEKDIRTRYIYINVTVHQCSAKNEYGTAVENG